MAFERIREMGVRTLARTTGFYLSVIFFLFLWQMIFGVQNSAGGFRVWFDPSLVDTHVVHQVTFFYFIWVFGLAMLAQLYKPKNRVTTMQIALLISIIALLENAPQFGSEAFNPMILVFLAPVFIAAALHPARNEVFSREQLSMDALNRPLLGLAAIALVPVGLYAAGQMNLQLTLTDDHAAVGHYGTIASYSIVFVVFAALASLGGQRRRAAAYAAAFLAIIFAAISFFEPAASAISPLWSAAAVLWAFAVVGTYELSAGGTLPDSTATDESPTTDWAD